MEPVAGGGRRTADGGMRPGCGKGRINNRSRPDRGGTMKEKVYCIQQSPRSYMVAFPRLGFHAMGESCSEAHAAFTAEYGSAIPPFEFSHQPMPRPRRHGDDAAQTATTIENILEDERRARLTECYRRWSKRLHPD